MTEPRTQPRTSPRETTDVFARSLCCVGGTRDADLGVAQVERLRHDDGTVTLVGVCESHLAARAGVHAADALADLRAGVHEALEAAARVAPDAHVRIVDGRPVPTLLHAVREEDATVVAVGDGHSRAAGIVFGGVTAALLHDAPCSVLVARPVPELAGFPRRIVAGVDGSAESLEAAAAARALASRLGCELRFVAATGGKPIEVDLLHGNGVDLHVDGRKPVDALLGAVEDGDLLVVGSRGLHGVRALGSVSERVAHYAPCPVLVVRPPVADDDRSPRRRGSLVRDVMTSPVVTAPPQATLAEIAHLMVDHAVGSVVVTDPADAPVGIVTATDFEVGDEPIPFTFFRWSRLLGEYVWSEDSLERAFAAAGARRVDSIMSAPVTAVPADAELWEAVRLMVAKEIKRIPVVEDGRVVGIVSQRDLLKWLLPEVEAST